MRLCALGVQWEAAVIIYVALPNGGSMKTLSKLIVFLVAAIVMVSCAAPDLPKLPDQEREGVKKEE